MVLLKSSLRNVVEQHEVRDTGRGQSYFTSGRKWISVFLNNVDEFRYRKSSHDAVQQLRGSRKGEIKAILYSGAFKYVCIRTFHMYHRASVMLVTFH